MRVFNLAERFRCSGFISVLIVILAVAWLAGCAAVDNVTRVQPSTGISSHLVKNPEIKSNDPEIKGSGTLVLQDDPKLFLVVYAIDENGKTVHPVPESEGLGSELYLTVDVSQILRAGLGNVKSEDEKRIIHFLLYVSNHNATLWMTRIYALNKARHGLVGGLKDLTTGGAGLSAFLSPPAAASLGVASLIIGGASNEIDTYVYEGKTIEVLFKGIEAARAVQYKLIIDKLNSDKSYDIYTALADVKQYDSLVSFRKGLEYLAVLADAKTAEAHAGGTDTGSPKNSSTGVVGPIPPKP